MKEIVSSLPGVFYRRPEPDKPVFVEEGDEVKAGDTIGLIEVMKSFQEVKAEADGVIKSIKVEDKAVVDAGQVVAELE
ncbi:biotin-dependent enzyme [Sinobaca qinghaiensis]|uniref:Biotin carboxyl carrier protein of acetyl-CoA carboxylase n=1 Tax=Sinobaca qinghaiensis TaxID=342944 RepID=A0A419V062_9BACL|nr:acetyl-CoA carboxylase [Sinobaca qinghaiensis]RKD71311.1 biotin-dependent enzyme [Sinobaca qinghaiensis]